MLLSLDLDFIISSLFNIMTSHPMIAGQIWSFKVCVDTEIWSIQFYCHLFFVLFCLPNPIIYKSWELSHEYDVFVVGTAIGLP